MLLTLQTVHGNSVSRGILEEHKGVITIGFSRRTHVERERRVGREPSDDHHSHWANAPQQLKMTLKTMSPIPKKTVPAQVGFTHTCEENPLNRRLHEDLERELGPVSEASKR